MGQIKDAFDLVYRDYAITGVPASGANEPVKSAIRGLGNLIDTMLGAATAGLLPYATKAALDADLTQDVGSLAYVYDDATAANNSVYQFVDGGWEAAGWYFDAVIAVAQPFVDAAVEPLEFGVGTDVIASATPAPQYFNGATARLDSDGVAWGHNIPAASSGADSSIIAQIPITGLARTGDDVDLVFDMTTSATFTRDYGMGVQVKLGDGSSVLRTSTEIVDQTTPGTRRIGHRYTIQGDEVELWPFTQTSTTSVAATDEWMLINHIALTISSPASELFTKADRNLEAFGTRLKRDVLARVALPTKTFVNVDPAGGTGVYTTITAANDAIDDAAIDNQYVILIKGDETYAESNIVTKDWVDYVGVGKVKPWIKAEQANDVDPAQTANLETFSVVSQSRFVNLRPTIKNGRYVWHIDNEATAGKTIEIVDCDAEHLGNQEARDYQTALPGGNPGGVWSSESVIGAALFEGTALIVRDSQLRAGHTAPTVYVRNSAAQSAPCELTVRRNKIFSDGNAGAISLRSFGSGQRDAAIIEGNLTDSWLNFYDNPDADIEWLVSGFGNTGLTLAAGVTYETNITDLAA